MCRCISSLCLGPQQSGSIAARHGTARDPKILIATDLGCNTPHSTFLLAGPASISTTKPRPHKHCDRIAWLVSDLS